MNDFIRNEGVLAIFNGDLVVGDATQQHQGDIVRFWKGWNHFQPAIGVGIERYLNDTVDAVGLTRSVRIELERDGQNVEAVRLGKGEIVIQARYD